MGTLDVASPAMPSTDVSTGATDRSLAGRLSALYHALLESRAARTAAAGEASLADLNDETLLDLGFDPASIRQNHGLAYSSSDPLARFYL